MLWWQFSPRQPQLPIYTKPEDQSATYQAGGADCRPEILARLAGKKASTETDRCSEATEEHRLKADDLIQQTRAADAAQSGAWTDFEATRVALWGLIGGLLTLVAAAFAAYYARRAYLETQRSADLAEKSLEITTRPFIHLKRLKWEDLREDDKIIGFRVTFYVNNLGHLPATNLRAYTSAQLGQLRKRVLPIYDETPIHIDACPRGVTRRLFAYIFPSDEELVRFEHGGLTAFLDIKIVFDTRFKKDKMIEERRWADRESVRKKLFYLEIPIADDAPLLDRMEGEHTENDDNQPRADG